MDRRTFLGLSATAMLAATQKGVAATLPSGTAEEKKEGVHIRFLGTGAADWHGRDERGELRRLTSILIDNRILIDFTPTDADMLPADCKPQMIFYTHSHGDHYNPLAALKLGVKDVYVSNTWIDLARSQFSEATKQDNLPMPTFHALFINEPVNVGDGLTLTPYAANHVTNNWMEQTLVYTIKRGKTRILYATDTGGIPAVSSRLIGLDIHGGSPKIPITALIMESTMGIGHEVDFRLFTHSSVALVKRTVDVLISNKRYLPPKDQPVYITHMMRTGHGTQAELDRDLPKPIKAAYDGLEVNFKPNSELDI